MNKIVIDTIADSINSSLVSSTARFVVESKPLKGKEGQRTAKTVVQVVFSDPNGIDGLKTAKKYRVTIEEIK